MDKMLTVNQKRATKHPKMTSKKKSKHHQPQPPPPQPLKVVYITNPIKFKATASEFRSLVQELTGQDADIPESARLPTHHGSAAVKAVAADDVTAPCATNTGSPNEETGSDYFTGFGSYDNDVFYVPRTTAEEFPELVAGSWHGAAGYDRLDVINGLDYAM